VPCTLAPTSYGFSVSASTTATTGLAYLVITVTSPGGAGTGGIVTTLTYPFTVG
jgi:hypothetical protein